MNKFEAAIRSLIELLVSVKDKSVLEILMGLGPMLFQLSDIHNHLATVPREQWITEIKTALDNLIGDEATAFIGSSPTAKIRVDLKYINIEALTDLILDSAAKAAAAAADNK